MIQISIFLRCMLVLFLAVTTTEMALASDWNQISCLNRQGTEWGNFDDTLDIDRASASFIFLSRGVGINDLKIEGRVEDVRYDAIAQSWNLNLQAEDGSQFWLTINEERKAKVTFQKRGQFSVVFENGFKYCRGLSKADFL